MATRSETDPLTILETLWLDTDERLLRFVKTNAELGFALTEKHMGHAFYEDVVKLEDKVKELEAELAGKVDPEEDTPRAAQFWRRAGMAWQAWADELLQLPLRDRRKQVYSFR